MNFDKNILFQQNKVRLLATVKYEAKCHPQLRDFIELVFYFVS